MPVDAAFEQLRRANPEPDPATLRRQLQDEPNSTGMIARRENMETRTPTVPTGPVSKEPRRWLPALAAGSLVILLGVPFLLGRDGAGVFGFFQTTPVEVAERYLDARNAGDAEAVRDLLADGVVFNDPAITDLEELDAGIEALRRYGFEFTSYECLESGVGPPASVTCTYMLEDTVQRIVGAPPTPGRFYFDVSEGRITNHFHDFNFTEYAPNVFTKFVEWLNTERPGGFDQLFLLAGGQAYPRLTPEALDLIPIYLAEFEAAFNG